MVNPAIAAAEVPINLLRLNDFDAFISRGLKVIKGLFHAI
jgi:hypothetical protein